MLHFTFYLPLKDFLRNVIGHRAIKCSYLVNVYLKNRPDKIIQYRPESMANHTRCLFFLFTVPSGAKSFRTFSYQSRFSQARTIFNAPFVLQVLL